MKTKYQLGIGILTFLLTIVFMGANISILTPGDNVWTNNATTEFKFTIDEYENATCGLSIDNMEVQILNASYNNTFVETLSEGTHDWIINCLTGNVSQSSDERVINIDLTEPVINLGLPADNANYTNLSSVAFTVTDNLITEINCSLNINGDEQEILALNGTESVVSITPITGENYWNVSCVDSADNKQFSETRIFTIVEPAEEIVFNTTIEYSTYNPGEEALLQIMAMPNSNITIDVCPNEEGFVLCKNTLEYTSEEYPIIVEMPYTDEAGDFIAEATMQYGEEVRTSSFSYTIRNNIEIDVDGDKSIAKEETTEIMIDVEGGISPYTYEWDLSEGGTSTKKDQNFTYDTPGEYENVLTVTDSVGNEKSEVVTIDVEEIYKLIVIVEDTGDNPIKNADVEIEDEDKKTNTNGEAVFLLKKGTYEIFASHANYNYVFEEDFRLKENDTVTIQLSKADNIDPKIIISSPKTGAQIVGSELSILFSVQDDADSVTCDIYLSEDDDAWYTKKDTIEVLYTTEYESVIKDLALGNYRFKIECTDLNKNVGSSDDIIITLAREGEVEFQGVDKNDNLITQLYEILDSLPQKTLEQKQVIDALDIENNLEQAIKTIERTTRDVYNVDYRRDLSTEQKVEKQNELLKNIDDIYQVTPIDIKVLGSKSFVKYIRDEELEPIIREYTELIGHEEKDAYYEASIESQKEVTITTNVKTVEIFYFNGEKETITLVVKELNYVNDSQTHRLIEHIPKTLVSSTDDMEILSEHKIIKKDPIIEFENPETIIYYVRDEIDVEQFDKANTVVLPQTYGGSSNRITGRSIFSSESIKFDAKTSLIILIIMLVIVYGGYSFSSFDRMKMFYYLVIGDKKLHNIKMLINDAEDNIETKSYEKAYLIYREIKLYYDHLSIPAKNEVFDLVVHVCNKLDYEYAQEIIGAITVEVNKGDKQRADIMYGKLRSIYKKLNDEDKKKIYSDVVKVTGMVAK